MNRDDTSRQVPRLLNAFFPYRRRSPSVAPVSDIGNTSGLVGRAGDIGAGKNPAVFVRVCELLTSPDQVRGAPAFNMTWGRGGGSISGAGCQAPTDSVEGCFILSYKCMLNLQKLFRK